MPNIPQPATDMLATISMFEQIKVEPLTFFQTCPQTRTLTTSGNDGQQHQQQQQIQVQTVQQNMLQQQHQHQNNNMQQHQQHRNDTQHHSTVITINDDKDNMQGNVVSFSRKVSMEEILIFFLDKFQQSETPLTTIQVDQIKPEIITNPAPQQQQQTHQNNTSRGSKPQACKICGKVLSSASSYYVHMKLHSGTKPFTCTVCEASFCRKPYLEVHMR
jgi:hypothetical protein